MKPTPVFVKVVSRKPIAFCPNEKDRNHLLAYVRETFECGHSKDYFFVEGAEPLTAKQRSCQDCFARVRRPKRVKAVKDAFGLDGGKPKPAHARAKPLCSHFCSVRCGCCSGDCLRGTEQEN
jgi:hypothetical protein